MVKTWAEKEMRNLIRWLFGVSVSVCAVSACQSQHLAPSRSPVILSRPGTLRALPVPEMCRGKQRCWQMCRGKQRCCWASRNHLLSLSYKPTAEEFCHGWVTWKALGASWEGFEFTVRVIKSLQDLKQGSDTIRLENDVSFYAGVGVLDRFVRPWTLFRSFPLLQSDSGHIYIFFALAPLYQVKASSSFLIWSFKYALNNGFLSVFQMSFNILYAISRCHTLGIFILLRKVREIVKDKEAWHVAVHDVSKSWDLATEQQPSLLAWKSFWNVMLS